MAELKVSPIASRLRASILQQAVEGRLVPQDPAEGTADELLEQIRDQRAELVKQKKAKAPKGGESCIYQSADGSWYEQRGKGEPKCIDKEIPFDIPESWAWARLGTITSYVQRGKSPKYSTIERYPVVAQKCNQWSGFSLEKAKFIDPETLDSYGPERFLIDGDLLWNSTGLGTLGRLAVYSSEVNPYECAVADSHVTVIRTMPLWMNYQYLFYYFAGPSVQSVIEKKASGTTKQKELALATVLTYPVPVPPLAEQERIVARIDEIMPLVDKLEIRERESDAVDSAFWRRLPQSILQEAVQGRLVPQDDADEPADLLLESIREQRAELVKQKKAKAPKGGESRIYQSADGSWYEQRGKGELKCIDKEIPFDIPESWAWVRLSTFALVLNGDRGKNYPAKSKLHKEGIPFVSAINIDNHRVVEDQMLYMTDEQYDALGAGKLEKEDFVFCIRGSLGKYGVFPFDKGAIASSLVIVRAVDDSSVSRDYIGMLLGTPITGSEIRSYNNGTAQPNLSAANFERFLYPVPPLAEQERIVSRVDEIMSLLDKAMN